MRYSLGDSGADISEAQGILIKQGFGWGLLQSGIFNDATAAAVISFQQAHIGPNGLPLSVDGVIGPMTWWALHNPSGKIQRNFLSPHIPVGIIGFRRRSLEIALAEHAAGVAEDPDGSNGGDGVDKYFEGTGMDHVLWCAAFGCWVLFRALGKHPLGRAYLSCRDFWRRAQEMMFKVNGPIPGDIGIILYSKGGRPTGSGHFVFVAAVGVNGAFINTVEGNAGNRVKVGCRAVETIHGFVDPYPELRPEKWERGLFEGADLGAETTR